VFPSSNAIYICILPSTNTECFLHGLATIFKELNGVPWEIWFDNLKPAVKNVLAGADRELSDTFARFKWHYRFEAKFCNVAKGNEKGCVEAAVGFVRRNILSPAPIITEDSDLKKSASAQMAAFREKDHYAKGKPIADLHKQDLEKLLPLPTEPFEVCSSQIVATQNKYGEIKVGDHFYKVPGAKPREKYFVKVFYDHIEVFDVHCARKVTTSPRTYMNRATDMDWPGLLALYRNKPRAIEDSIILFGTDSVVLILS